MMGFFGFASRMEAGKLLAERLEMRHFEEPVVLALPRGGVPVALEVARALKAPLDLILVRKIGVPWQPELAAAAIVDGERRELVFNEEVMALTGVHKEEIERLAEKQIAEIERRRALYLKDRQPVAMAGKTAIVIDDGIATGTTAKAALQALRKRGPKRLVLAVPVAPPDTIEELRPHVDEIVCLEQPTPFYAIGAFYRDFHQVEDEEVVAMLAAAASPGGRSPRG
ncbi:MAG: phosphoribosyltransferase [Rhizobiales bacterium]|nr:phosphoribosyltransferase [Hyphomicrobiales bacterium]MBI3673656.1 phosphoribosyltransferase [Hyphomicrobiales bacterium]